MSRSPPSETEQELAALREAVRVRDALLSATAHELMSPVHALLLKVDLASRQLEAGRSELATARLRDCGHELQGMVLRLRTLLDTSLLLAGQMHVVSEEVDLSALAGQTARAMGELAARAGSRIVLETDGPVWGLWDRVRLEQLCGHLLTHAVKHAGGSPIRLGVRAQGGWAELRVRDEGPGVEQARLDRIFQPFERAVNPEESGGFGLRLWVSRQLALALRGELEAHSAPGRGSELTVRIPLVELAAGPRRD